MVFPDNHQICGNPQGCLGKALISAEAGYNYGKEGFQMKKFYSEPSVEVVELESVDVIMASGDVEPEEPTTVVPDPMPGTPEQNTDPAWSPYEY